MVAGEQAAGAMVEAGTISRQWWWEMEAAAEEEVILDRSKSYHKSCHYATAAPGFIHPVVVQS